MSGILNLLIQSNTLNFLIVLLIIVALIKYLKFGEKIDKIKEEIKTYVETSEKEKSQAEVNLTRINDKLSKLPAVIERIQKSTEKNINNIEQNVKKNTEIQKQDISKNSERLFKLETKKFKEKLTNLLSEKSVEVARNNAIQQLKENPMLHAKYIDSAIDELDEISL